MGDLGIFASHHSKHVFLGAYDIYCYAQEEMVKAGALHDYCKTNWAYVLAGDAKAKDKPLIIGEDGFWMGGSGSATNPLRTDHDGFPAALDHFLCNLGAGVEIRCEANSMLLLSSMEVGGSSVFEAH